MPPASTPPAATQGMSSPHQSLQPHPPVLRVATAQPHRRGTAHEGPPGSTWLWNPGAALLAPQAIFQMGLFSRPEEVVDPPHI